VADTHIASLLLVFGLILLNAFFVAAEFALISIRQTRVQELVSTGNRRAKMIQSALDDINAYLSTVQVGVTMCALAIGWVGESAVSSLLRPPVTALGFGEDVVSFMSIAVGFLAITYVSVVVGELLPKNAALQKTERIVLATIVPLQLLRRLLSPFVFLLDRGSRVLQRLTGVNQAPGMHVIHSEEELKLLVSQSSKGGVLEDSEKDMLYNVFEFADTSVAEVMVPRPDVVAFDVSTPPAELLQLLVEQPFTRYPVYRSSMDDIVGILHLRDIFNAAEQQGKDRIKVESLLRPAHVVPESKSLAGLLSDFRRSKSHMALVIDEYGSLAGIVTLEDLIEEIVGEIDDEHDRPEQLVEHISEHHIRVDGKFPVDELNDRFQLDLPTGDYHTIGGFVFSELGQQPHEGDVVRHQSTRFEVTETDGPRIVHVDIIMLPAAGQASSNGGSANGHHDHNGVSADVASEPSMMDTPPG
jgi:CBS domain containing-hemolysin-like protein